MRHRSNPLDYDAISLDDAIRAFPYDAEARRELVAFRAEQDPEASLDENIEWLLFSAFDGGVVDDDEWADAACAAGFPEGYEREQRAVIGHYGQSIPYDTVGALERLWIAAATSLTS